MKLLHRFCIRKGLTMKKAFRPLVAFSGVLLATTALAQQPKERAFLQSHKSDVMALAISADSKLLASGDAVGVVKVWDLATGKEMTSFNNPAGALLTMAISPDGKTVATASGGVVLWDSTSGKKLQVLPFESFNNLNDVAFSPDGKILIAGGNGKLGDKTSPTIRTWDPNTGKEGEAISFTDRATKFAFLPDSKSVLVSATPANKGAQILLLDLSTGKLKPLWSETAGRPVFATAPDGKRAAFSFTDGLRAPADVKTADIGTGKVQGTLKVSHTVYRLAFTPDGKTLVATGSLGVAQPGAISFWDVASKKQRSQLKEPHSFNVGAVAIAPDGKTLATGSQDKKNKGELKLWDLPAK
jgi:WD40 repeat protein